VGATSRALARIRDAMKAQGVSQRALAERLNCSQGRVAKILKGRIRLTVEDLEEVAAAVGLQLVETIRNRGVEFFAELTPTELRVIELMREHPHIQRAFADLLDAAVTSARVSSKRGTLSRRVSDKSVLNPKSASGKTLESSSKGLPDGLGVPDAIGDSSALEHIREYAGKLSLLLGVFASGGSERDAAPTASREKPAGR
jgi:transcriptional regulator with XRE-family HTH domain